jgi:hypothetical protein
MTRSPTELEPEVEASRRALARDVGALKQRATPRRMLGDAMDTVRTRGRNAGRQVLRTARSEPVWLSVVGGVIAAGGGAYLIAQLVASRRRPRTLPEHIRAAPKRIRKAVVERFH